MEFGRISVSELKKTDLSLPADPAQTTRILAKNKKPAKVNIRVGCAKWGRADWVNKIYPKGTKPANFLEAYAKQYDCIEYNAIFYKVPTKEEITLWKSKVAKDFKFCPKFSDMITHIRRLKNADAAVDEFLKAIHLLGKNLGPVFLMPHPQMGPKHFDTIKAFLDSLPKKLDLFVELRHKEWYLPENAEKIFTLLEKKKFGTVITDTAGRRDCVHMHLTTPNVFIRFVGNSLHKTDYKRIDDWVERIQQWSEQGLKNCWFFMHQHDELYSPELSKYLIEQLNKKCGQNIKVPVFYGKK